MTTDRTTTEEPVSTLAALTAVCALGLIMIGAAILIARDRPTRSARAVEEQVRAIALGEDPQSPGQIGTWTLGARGSDAATGDLLNLHLESGPVLLAAERARIVVDAEQDAFGLQLTDVVITRFADPSDRTTMLPPVRLPSYFLGPIPLEEDVIADEDDAPVVLSAAPTDGE